MRFVGVITASLYIGGQRVRGTCLPAFTYIQGYSLFYAFLGTLSARLDFTSSSPLIGRCVMSFRFPRGIDIS